MRETRKKGGKERKYQLLQLLSHFNAVEISERWHSPLLRIMECIELAMKQIRLDKINLSDIRVVHGSAVFISFF